MRRHVRSFGVDRKWLADDQMDAVGPNGDVPAIAFGAMIGAPTVAQHLDWGAPLAPKKESGLQYKALVSEPALERAERLANLLASIVESSDDAIVSKNLDGIITSWNKAAERIFGYSAPEAIGRPITLVIPEDRQSEEREILSLDALWSARARGHTGTGSDRLRLRLLIQFGSRPEFYHCAWARILPKTGYAGRQPNSIRRAASSIAATMRPLVSFREVISRIAIRWR